MQVNLHRSFWNRKDKARELSISDPRVRVSPFSNWGLVLSQLPVSVVCVEGLGDVPAEVKLLLAREGRVSFVDGLVGDTQENNRIEVGGDSGSLPELSLDWRWKKGLFSMNGWCLHFPALSSATLLVGVFLVESVEKRGRLLTGKDIDDDVELCFSSKNKCSINGGVFAFQGWEVLKDFLIPCLNVFRADERRGNRDMEEVFFEPHHGVRLVEEAERAIKKFCDDYIFHRQNVKRAGACCLAVFRFADGDVSGEFNNEARRYKDFCVMLSMVCSRYLSEESGCNWHVVFIAVNKKDKKLKGLVKRRYLVSGDGRVMDCPNNFTELTFGISEGHGLGVVTTTLFHSDVVGKLERLCSVQRGLFFGDWIHEC